MSKLYSQHWEVNQLPDSAFSSSSDWNRNHAAKFARFDSKPKFANWSAGKNEIGEWLQIDLGQVRTVKSVRIQGRHNQPQWVTKYDLWIGNDLSDWTKFENINGPNGQDEFTEFDFSGDLQNARYIRFLPTTWENHMSMRVDVCVSGESGNDNIDIASKSNLDKKWIIDELPDSAFSSSSDFNKDHSCKNARFNSRHAIGNWSAKKNIPGEWLQIDLGDSKPISAVRIQGRFNHSQWVTSYNLSISQDGLTWVKFENLDGVNGEDDFREFELPEITLGRYVRFYPTKWNKHISMRIDVAVAGNTGVPENEEEDEVEKGFAPMALRFGEDTTEETATTYFRKWQVESSTYNGRLGINCIVPSEASALINPAIFPELNPDDLSFIINQVSANKIIPLLNFLDNDYGKHTKRVWWMIPFCIWRDDIASPVFADKNGIYGMYEDNMPDATQLVSWENLSSMEFEDGFDDDPNVNRIYLNVGEDHISLDELVDPEKGTGSYLAVLFAIYNLRKATIEASKGAPGWYEGVGGEGFIGFDAGLDLINPANWKNPTRPNPAEYGYNSSRNMAPEDNNLTEDQMRFIELKSEILTTTLNSIAFVYVCVAGVDGSIVENEEAAVKEKLAEWSESGHTADNYKLAKEFWQTLDGESEKQVLMEAIQSLKETMPEETINSLMADIFSITDADGSIEESEKAIVNFIIGLLS